MESRELCAPSVAEEQNRRLSRGFARTLPSRTVQVSGVPAQMSRKWLVALFAFLVFVASTPVYCIAQDGAATRQNDNDTLVHAALSQCHENERALPVGELQALEGEDTEAEETDLDMPATLGVARHLNALPRLTRHVPCVGSDAYKPQPVDASRLPRGPPSSTR